MNIVNIVKLDNFKNLHIVVKFYIYKIIVKRITVKLK